jgi:hypothetical protein
MYHKIKNTLSGLAITLAMLGVSYSVGNPPARIALHSPAAGQELPAPLDELQAARQSLRSMRSQLSMPFYSFAPLLPRREG